MIAGADIRKPAAEGIGTFFLVLIGPGALMVDAWTAGAVGHAGVALSFAFVVTAMGYALGNVSGAHINPAVTITFWLSGKLHAQQAILYVVAQCTGGIAAAFLLRALLGDTALNGATVPALSLPAAFAVEWFLSFVLMFVIASVATGSAGAFGALAVGLTVGFDAMMGGQLTGASMNPARSLGPAVAGGVWTAHWIYWVAPLTGMVAGNAVWQWLAGSAFSSTVADSPASPSRWRGPRRGG